MLRFARGRSASPDAHNVGKSGFDSHPEQPTQSNIMTPEERQKRWEEIDRELEELWAGKVCDDPVKREGELLEEQDALEFDAGMEWFRKRDEG